eukprot:COSAG02_NODE_22251_length_758_cov_1.244310_1_plen_195_part_10
MQGWFYALKRSKGLMPSKIPAGSRTEKKLVELLSNEVEASIKEANKNAVDVEDTSDETTVIREAGRTVEAAAHATNKLGFFGGAARIAPLNVAPLGAGNNEPAQKPKDNPRKVLGYQARALIHQEQHVQDAVMMLENRKDILAGLRQGLNWLDIDTDWSVNDSKEPINYWKETASEQAWSKSKDFLLYVSEYSSV